jgi:hypothetical protein
VEHCHDPAHFSSVVYGDGLVGLRVTVHPAMAANHRAIDVRTRFRRSTSGGTPRATASHSMPNDRSIEGGRSRRTSLTSIVRMAA